MQHNASARRTCDTRRGRLRAAREFLPERTAARPTRCVEQDKGARRRRRELFRRRCARAIRTVIPREKGQARWPPRALAAKRSESRDAAARVRAGEQATCRRHSRRRRKPSHGGAHRSLVQRPRRERECWASASLPNPCRSGAFERDQLADLVAHFRHAAQRARGHAAHFVVEGGGGVQEFEHGGKALVGVRIRLRAL